MRRWGNGCAVMASSMVLLLAGETGSKAAKRIGREVAIERHLAPDDEFRLSLPELLAHGQRIFSANWTDQEGAGRPLTKGTGRALSDMTQPLNGLRTFNRLSGPDANSCAGCHNTPHGLVGGGGDFTANVFVLGQRFDFLTFDANDRKPTRGGVDEKGQPVTLQSSSNLRASPGLFGAGYLEMLAREMTAELQRTRDSIRPGQTKALSAKGIYFGELTRRQDGLWDTSKVTGLSRASLDAEMPQEPPSLIVRPWHQASNLVSLREFANTSFNQHHGIQSTERFGMDTDLDGDGFTNELTRGDVTAVTLWQATLQVPGRVIPNDPEIEAAVLTGEKVFEKTGCAACHIPELPLTQAGWTFTEPGPYNPLGNLRQGETKPIHVNLNDAVLPPPRLQPDRDRPDRLYVPAYTDMKLHDITDAAGDAEPLDQNQTVWSARFATGNRRFMTKRLWGCANEPPYFHHGLFTTLRQAVLAHSGEAKASRVAFQQLEEYEQDSLIEFLKTLQALPPGTLSAVVDEQYKPRAWPPKPPTPSTP